MAPPVRTRSPSIGAQEIEVVVAQSFDVADSLQDGREPVRFRAVAPERETLRRRRDEREALARRRERVCQHRGRLVGGGGATEFVEIAAGEVPGYQARTRARRAAREPVPGRGPVRIDGTERVVDQFVSDALDDERRAEDRVPPARTQRSGTELRGAAVGHARDHRRAHRDSGRCCGRPPHRSDDRP